MKRKVVCALIASMILSVAAPAAVHAEVLPTTMVSEEAASEEAPEETAESLAEEESEEAEAESAEAEAESAEAESAEAESTENEAESAEAEAESAEAAAESEEAEAAGEETAVEDESAEAQTVGAASAIATKAAAAVRTDKGSGSLDDEFFHGGTKNAEEKKAEKDEFEAVLKETRKRAKLLIENSLDYVIKQFPGLTPLGGTLKAIIADAYGFNTEDRTKVIEQKLKDLSFQVDMLEASVKRSTGNIVTLNTLGNAFSSLDSRAKALGIKVKDVYDLYDAGYINREEKLARIGALYNSAEYAAAVATFNDATMAYEGKTSIELDEVSIFGAAYRKQSESNMFSGEVIDGVTPYLARLMGKYAYAYGVINEVLDASQLSNGTAFAKSSRESLDQSMETVMKRYEEFYKTDRDVFINKGNCSIRLKKQLLVKENYGKSLKYEKNVTPAFMKANPLNKDQVEALAKYAAERGKTLFEYLINDMKFYPVRVTDEEKAERTAQGIYDVQNVYPFEAADMTRHIVTGHPYLVTGAQNLEHVTEMSFGYCVPPMYVRVQAIAMDQVGAGNDKIKIKSYYPGAVEADLLFFLAA